MAELIFTQSGADGFVNAFEREVVELRLRLTSGLKQ